MMSASSLDHATPVPFDANLALARLLRPPEAGATLVSVDENSVRNLPGFVKVVTRKNFAGVVAEKPWQAR